MAFISNFFRLTDTTLSGTIADLLAAPIFWLLAAVLIALELVAPIHRRPRETGGRLATNFGLGAINMALFYLLPLSTVLAGAWARQRGIGLLNLLAVPGAVNFTMTIVIQSLVAYGLHVLSHNLPLLWRIHCVHHTDTAVDLSTGFRHHPFELLFVAGGHALAAVALGLSVAGLAAYAALAVVITLWTHVNFQLPAAVEKCLQLMLVTPAMHHVHHSAARDQTDSNYGELFSLWDRIFGTYCACDPDDLRSTRFGLGDSYEQKTGRLLGQLTLPFAPPVAALPNAASSG